MQCSKVSCKVWNLKKVTMIAILGLLTMGTVFSSSLVGCNLDESIVDSMKDTGVKTKIPAIDAAAPLETVTASFALG